LNREVGHFSEIPTIRPLGRAQPRNQNLPTLQEREQSWSAWSWVRKSFTQIHSPRLSISLESNICGRLQIGSDLIIGPFGPTTAFQTEARHVPFLIPYTIVQLATLGLCYLATDIPAFTIVFFLLGCPAHLMFLNCPPVGITGLRNAAGRQERQHSQTQKNPHQHYNWHEAGVGAHLGAF
jgi:hypothetical protein